MTELELPTIDDRTYSELLAEVTARIPVHNPDWVNFNDSDPGMTLLQLWAFMSENLLYQSRLIPERVRMKFLELLGIDLAPATAARGIVAFEFLKGRLEMSTIPVDRELLAGQVPFRTTTGLTAAPIEVQAFTRRRIEPESDFDEQYALLFGSFLEPGQVFDYYESARVEWSATASTAVDLGTTVDGALWLALLARKPAQVDATREVLGGQVLTLGFVPDVDVDNKVLEAGGDAGDAATPGVLEFHLPDTSVALPESPTARVPTYRPVESRTDSNVLLEPGVVELMLPPATQLGVWTDLEPGESGVGRFPPALEGDDAARLITWIRIRAAGGDDEAGGVSAKLTWAGANAALVEQRAHTAREVVGSGTGLPDQRFKLANTPVLLDTVHLTVDDVEWELVDDLMEAGPEVPTSSTTAPDGHHGLPSRVARVSRSTGEIAFGDGLHGARPPAGSSIVAAYDSGGGRQGLVGASSIAKASFLPSGAKVTNPLPTWGADDAQSVVEAERTISTFVRHRDRLVAAADFDDVVRATPGIDLGRVEVLPLVHPDLPGQQLPGVVTLLLLPLHDAHSPDAPSPDQHFLRAVCEYVEPRRLITSELHLRGPVYEPVWVSIGIDVVPGRAVGPVREAVKAAVREFLSPLTGGHLGAGWPLSTPVNRLEILAVAARVDGVGSVFGTQLAGLGGTPFDEIPMPTRLHLPELVGLEVRQGDPLPIAELQGVAETTPSALPIPVIPEECC